MSQEIIRNNKCLRQSFFFFLDKLTIDSLATYEGKTDFLLVLELPPPEAYPLPLQVSWIVIGIKFTKHSWV